MNKEFQDIIKRWQSYSELDEAEYYDANGDTIHDVNKGNLKGKLKLLRESYFLLKDKEQQIKEEFQRTLTERCDFMRDYSEQRQYYNYIESAYYIISEYHENKYLISNYLIDEMELDEYHIPAEKKSQFVFLLHNEKNALKFIRLLEAIKMAKDEICVSAQDITNTYKRCNGKRERGYVECLYSVLSSEGLGLYLEKEKNLYKFFARL